MLRIDKVRQVLAGLSQGISIEDIKHGFDGFETEEVAEVCNLARTNTSKELNALVKLGEAVKISGRPVRYFSNGRLKDLLGTDSVPSDPLRTLQDVFFSAQPAENDPPFEYEEDFNNMLARRPSLKTSVDQGKAAMLYPPNGLNTLLVGESGVGKTFFAEAMFRYGEKKGLLKPNAKYVVFNCAEYASNPQLLLSNLFGYAKGAFTGADGEKPGLIDAADGGLLLLDEVHRLPESGQEMLFTLIDKGYFRRMGDTAEVVRVNFRLVCATTEDIESNMLATFRRRIPMVIHLPSLAEHSLAERYALICRFFTVEAKNIGVPLKVSWPVLAALLCYPTPGNVGQLCSDIQLTCARGFLEMELRAQGKEAMEIVDTLLPETVKRDATAIEASEAEIDSVLGFRRGAWAIFEETGNIVVSTTVVDTVSLYHKIRQLHANYASHNYKKVDIVENINQYIEEYLGLSHVLEKRAEEGERERLYTLVGRPVYFAALEALEDAQRRLKRAFGRKVIAAFCLHVSVLLEQIHIRYACAINWEDIEKKQKEYPAEFAAARHMMDIISERLSVEIPREEVAFFSAFLHSIEETEIPQSAPGVLVLMHGNSTASSMAEVANTILNTSICQAMDLNLDENANHFYERLCEKLLQVDRGAGVLILADIGSLGVMAEKAAKQLGLEMRCIEMASTLTVLEATRKCLYHENSLDMLYRELMRTLPLAASAILENNHSNRITDEKKRDLIIVTCISGMGAAQRLCEIIAENVPEIQEYNIQLAAHDKDGSKLSDEERHRAILVAGAVDLKIPDVAYIEVDDIIMGSGFKRIGKLVRGEGPEPEDHRDTMPPSVLGKMLSQYLVFLDPIKANDVVSKSFEVLCQNLAFSQEDIRRTKIRYLLHGACLIERAILGQQLMHEEVQNLKRQKRDLFQAVAQAAQVIELAFGIEIDDTELAYITELVSTE